MRNVTYLSLILLSLFSVTFLNAQGTQVEFGKNRVQYHEDFKEWLQYESVNFITYFYGEGRNIAQSVVQIAELDHDAVQNILEHRMSDKIEIIVYTDLTDLKQSNIGSEEAFINTGGQTKIVENKIFVYFNGDHNHLRTQIREGIATVYLNAMLFGSNLQEIVQNAVMMNLPEWFKIGLISYIGEEWNTTLDDQLRDVILNGEYKDFQDFADDNPELAGHSMWYFIGQNYGKSTVSNLLYLTRIYRSIDNGFLYVLGSSYGKTTTNWEDYFKQRYGSEVTSMEKPDGDNIKVKNKRKLPLTRLKISPDGNKIAYVSNDIGKYKVYIQDLQNGERRVIHKGGFRNSFQATDYNYPMIAWSPNNMEIAVLYEKHDVPKMMIYDLNTKDKTVEDLGTEYQRVYSMDFINASQMVFSATVRGFSDIFIYYLKTRQTERITNDFYDDLDASFAAIGKYKGILFVSNRQDSMATQLRLDSILPINTFDVYFYNLQTKSKELVRITNTPLTNERMPVAADSSHFSFLSDQSGIYNRQIGYLEDYIAFYEQLIILNDGTEIILHRDSMLASLDSTLIDTIIIQPVIKQRAVNHNTTNYVSNIAGQHFSSRTGKGVESLYHNGEYNFYVIRLDSIDEKTPAFTRFQQQRFKIHNKALSSSSKPEKNNKTTTPARKHLEEVSDPPTDISKVPQEKQDTGKIDIDNYLFQSEFDDDDEEPAKVVVEEDEGKIVLQPQQKAQTITPSQSTVQPTKNKTYEFNPSRIIPYRLKFRTDYVTTQLDNSLLFGGLDSYATSQDNYSYPPLGILLKANFKDLFEDYEFNMGVRIPTTFNGAEYFIVFDDKKKRLDKRYAIYRRNMKYTFDRGSIIPAKSKETVLLGQMELRYPLDIFRSFRLSGTLRFDRTFLMATELATFDTPSLNQQRFGLRLEYVFDNTLDVAINIKNGTRYKIFAEVVKKANVDLLDNVTFNFKRGFMTVLGLDARHYQRLDKHSIFAMRIAGATSFGSEKILYFLGGVDNWMFQQFNHELAIPISDDFAFQTLASNLRGFKYNIRNGNNYALLNNELRVPVFKYFSKNLKSSFFLNFQLVGFFDVGTAWQGPTPYDKDSPLNTVTISNPTVNVTVNYFRDPIVAGYGFGVRSVLFGYFIRFDYAWGIETRVVQDPIFYFSLGKDF